MNKSKKIKACTSRRLYKVPHLLYAELKNPDGDAILYGITIGHTNISEHLPAPMDAETFKETMMRHIMNGSTDTYTVTPGDDALCAALLGCPYERGAVLEALQSHGIDGAVYRISAQELASVVVD